MDRLGSIFEAEMAVFSTLLRARTRARRTCCNRAETLLKLMFRPHQSRRATRRGRRKMAQISLCEPFGKLVCQCRAKNPHHLGVQKPSRARTDASPRRPCAPKPTQDRFMLDVGTIWDGFSKDFSSIFARVACDEGTKQNPSLHCLRCTNKT